MDYLGASGSEVIPYDNLSGMRLVASRSSGRIGFIAGPAAYTRPELAADLWVVSQPFVGLAISKRAKTDESVFCTEPLSFSAASATRA